MGVGTAFVSRISKDPLGEMHGNKRLVLGYTGLVQLTKTAQSHKALWEKTLLYLLARGADLSQLPHTLKSGKNIENDDLLASILEEPRGPRGRAQWNRMVLAAECKVLRLNFFRAGSTFADYISFLKMHQSQPLTDHGTIAIHTLGTALALWFWQTAQGVPAQGP